MTVNTDVQALIDKAVNEAKAATIDYASWKQRVDSGWYTAKGVNPATGTAWGRFFAAAKQARDLLNVAAPAPTPTPTPTPTPPPSGSVLWQGNFETNNFSQFDDATQGYHNAVVSNASANGGPASARKGTYFYQSEVHSGDNIAGGERCEIIKGGIEADNGIDRYYAWSFALSSTFPAGNSTTGGTLLGQFHSNSDDTLQGQANIQIGTAPNFAGVNYGHSYANPGLFLGINGGNPTQKGQWYDINGQTNGLNGDPYTSCAFDLGPLSLYAGVGWVDWVFRVVWSDHGAGTVQLWRKLPGGTLAKIVDLANCSNIYKTHSAYLKLGQNRKQSSGLANGFAWYDEAARGTTLAAVTPS